MKLTKVHIALLTNFTEGKAENEHITMYFSKEVTAKTVIKRMTALNELLPIDLGASFNKTPQQFISWSGELITALVTNARRWEKPEVELFESIPKVHITLGKDLDPHIADFIMSSGDSFNWEHGGLVGECHAGFKNKDGKVEYFTVEQLAEYAYLKDNYPDKEVK